jgi:hypothetical protein
LVTRPGRRRRDVGSRQIGFSLPLRCVRLVKLPDGALPLRSQHFDLLLRREGIVLGCPQGCLFLLQFGRRLLRLLHCRGTSFHELLYAVVLLLREGQHRLRLRDLLIGLIDLGLLGFDLRI